jgi:hypothetical protein
MKPIFVAISGLIRPLSIIQYTRVCSLHQADACHSTLAAPIRIALRIALPIGDLYSTPRTGGPLHTLNQEGRTGSLPVPAGLATRHQLRCFPPPCEGYPHRA